MNYSVVLLCAGKGKRTGLDYNKMLYKMNDRTVYENTIAHFINDARCTQIIVVTSKEETEVFKKLVHDDRILFTLGGKERYDSVYAGLQLVRNEYVMIHDGARPYLSKVLLDRLCDCLNEHEACLLMTPSTDTIKEVDNCKVIQTYDRTKLMNAQTPQAFKTSIILEAYKKGIESHFIATDDSQMVEVFTSYEVYAVLGDYANKKITTPEDL